MNLRRFTVRRISFLGVVLFWLSMSQAQAAITETKTESLTAGLAAVSTIAVVFATNPMEADRMVFEAGRADHVYVLRGGAQWDWKHDLLTLGGFRLDSYLQFDYSKWQSTLDSSQKGNNNAIGLTPFFRFSRVIGSVPVYIETGIGAYLISSTTINDRRFSTNFQFGDSLGMGVFLGERRQWTLGYKFQHHSNNGIKLPNNGLNIHFFAISYAYHKGN